MKRLLFMLVLLAIPLGAGAERAPASFTAARSILSENSTPGNSYIAGISVVVTAPIEGDLSAVGGSIVTAAPITGDGLLMAGTVSSRSKVSGDLRTAGGSITVDEPVLGDLAAFGLSVKDLGRVTGNVFIVAANTTIGNGANGPVTIYGNNISLAGNFSGDVTIVAGGRVALAASTTIDGKLSYQAPEPAIIPASAKIGGGVKYTNASYLPDAGTSRVLALISIGFFLLVRILSALILAGLFAGLFPRLAEMIADRATLSRFRDVLLTVLLGFAAFIVGPVLLALLLLTFVGIGLAFLLIVSYALLCILSLIYAGILVGSLLTRRYAHRDVVYWHDGVLGMLCISLLSLIPVIGFFIVGVLMTFAAGSLLIIFFNFAFRRDDRTPELL